MKWLAVIFFALISALSFADQSIYTDQLNNGWQNWSWASVNLSSTTLVHSGKDSIAVTGTGGYQALYLACPDQSSQSYQAISFWINGGSKGGQQLSVKSILSYSSGVAYNLPPLKANVWIQVFVPMYGVGAGSVDNLDGIWIQDRSGAAQPTYYVDDISLTAKANGLTSAEIFADTLENSWTNDSTANVSLDSTKLVHSGKYSISVSEEKVGQGLYLAHPQLNSSLFQTITFWINGGTSGGQILQVNATASGTPQATYTLPALPKNSWQEVVIPLQSLGIDNRGDFDGLSISSRSKSVQPTYYVDDIAFSTTPITNPLVTISVNTASRTPISPYIYGVNSSDFTHLGPGFTFARQGGNRLTAFNWENNASNAGSDYQYENDAFMGVTNVAGWANLTFLQAAQAGGAAALLTVPIVDYVAYDKNGGGDVRNTPNYLSVRMRQNLAVKPGKKYVYPPDATDAYVYEDEYVHYISQFGTSKLPIMFDLDNEPDLWSSTHPEVHPKPVTYAEIVSRDTSYSASIKSVVPNALVFGPVNYGWEGYRTLQNAPDANGRDFLGFYLASMAAASKSAKARLLDVLDLHWYPEATGDGIRITSEGDSDGLANARIQASRSLWDPTYVEDSWISQSINNAAIELIPNTTALITKNYPGTNLSFSEYNYGGGNSISGAIAQADVLGVFGRYGVFAAANWGLSVTETSELAGFQSFINYDRVGSKFGNLELPVKGETASQNSVYAALDSTNNKRLTLVIINKTIGTTPFTIDLSKFVVASSKAYMVSEGNYTKPVATSVTNLSDAISYTAPPLSVTTVELISK
jgi:hypothetical protein